MQLIEMEGGTVITATMATQRQQMRRHGVIRARNATSDPQARTPVWQYGVGFLMAFALFTALLGNITARPSGEVSRYVTVTVGESGTLWEIAAAHPIPGLATAETVALIRSANALDSGLVHAGQVLQVPASDTPVSVGLAAR